MAQFDERVSLRGITHPLHHSICNHPVPPTPQCVHVGPQQSVSSPLPNHSILDNRLWRWRTVLSLGSCLKCFSCLALTMLLKKASQNVHPPINVAWNSITYSVHPCVLPGLLAVIGWIWTDKKTQKPKKTQGHFFHSMVGLVHCEWHVDDVCNVSQ